MKAVKYIPTIGLEIHAELKTRTKMFCDSANDPDERHPNINICPVCMGHPGTLPVINKQAVEQVIRAGLALNCTIAKVAKFDRKNYFYPDLPKGYQISQYDMPFCTDGFLDVLDGKRIRVQRIHLEEDTGRLQHSEDGAYSYVDFNRAGVPLMELVTHPDIHGAEEAKAFAQELQLILRYLGASDADMEKGQMRVEVNISLAKDGAEKLGTKVEVKNLNSLRAVERAIAYEAERQNALLEVGERIVQETRGWDDANQKTVSQREKEEAHDYRYFPEPDLPPMLLQKEHGLDIEALAASLPELPSRKRERFCAQYGLDKDTAEIFVQDGELADYYEKVRSEIDSWEDAEEHGKESQTAREHLYVLATNYIVTNLRPLMQEQGTYVTELKITPENFAELVSLVHRNIVSSTGAKETLRQMYHTGEDPSHIVEELGLSQTSNLRELEEVVRRVLDENAGTARDYINGKENALQFLVGQVMKETKGRANPKLSAEIILRELKK